MAKFEMGSVSIEVDEDGFMQEPEKWNEEVAAALGETEGVDTLTDDHWKVVNYLREYYMKFGVAPMIRKLCKESGFKLKEIYATYTDAEDLINIGAFLPIDQDTDEVLVQGGGDLGIGEGFGEGQPGHFVEE